MTTAIYIAGPMRGRPHYNHDAFVAAEAALRDAHPEAVIFNPATQFDGDKTLPLRAYYGVDFEFLRGADAIAFLPGWKGSEGARIEYAIARSLNLGFILLTDDGFGFEVASVRHDWSSIAPLEDEAWRLVYGDRGTTYGHPSDNFKRIAELWSAQFGWECSAQDVATAMELFKIARKAGSYKRDNDVDQIGYVLAGQRMVEE